jgi:hypothetical protein
MRDEELRTGRCTPAEWIAYRTPVLVRLGSLADLTRRTGCTFKALKDKTGASCNNKTR